MYIDVMTQCTRILMYNDIITQYTRVVVYNDFIHSILEYEYIIILLRNILA